MDRLGIAPGVLGQLHQPGKCHLGHGVGAVGGHMGDGHRVFAGRFEINDVVASCGLLPCRHSGESQCVQLTPLRLGYEPLSGFDARMSTSRNERWPAPTIETCGRIRSLRDRMLVAVGFIVRKIDVTRPIAERWDVDFASQPAEDSKPPATLTALLRVLIHATSMQSDTHVRASSVAHRGHHNPPTPSNSGKGGPGARQGV